MKQLMCLIKACMSQDMNLFKIKTKSKNKYSNVLLILILVFAVFYTIGVYAYSFADALNQIGKLYVMLSIFIAFTTILSFIEAIYKSQGILFDAKDNDLLFSLPIEKNKILFARLIKLLSFQLLYNALFLIPAIIVYIIFKNPPIKFYFIAILILIMVPIIPTVLGTIIGYIIKSISSKFKSRKIIQTVITMILFLAIFGLSFKSQSMVSSLTDNADGISNIINNIFYPIKLYIDLINNFNMVSLMLLIAINIIPLILFIYIAGISYFKLISKLSENRSYTTKAKNNINTKNSKNYKQINQMDALILKELKRYFSSPIYIFNTSFGILLMLVITIGISINLNGMITMVTNGNLQDVGFSTEQIKNIMPIVFYELVIFISCMTQITASSISLEGKSFNITKSLPIKTEKILLSKILTSDIITIPTMILSDIIFFIFFKVDVIEILYILLATILIPNMMAIVGIMINLRFPKMSFSSDTEVVKQSISTFVSVLIGFIFAIISIVLVNIMSEIMDINVLILIELIVFLIINIILWKIGKRYGEKRFNEINV